MKKITVLMLMGLCVLFSAHICRAEKAYVINTSKITLRGGPSTQDKIIAMLRQGTPVEVIDTQSGWSHVRVVENGSRNYEGYMVNGFLTRDVPWKVQAEGLREENVRLKQRAENIEKSGPPHPGKRN